MKSLKILLLFVFLPIACKSWEYCQARIHKELCGEQTHYVCDKNNEKNSIPEPTQASNEFLEHVPITRKLKKAFLNWHNYYRNLTAGGYIKNNKKVRFPKAVRMRELIWDVELSFLSHVRTKLVNKGDAECTGTRRFPYAGQSTIVNALPDRKPVLEIVYLAMKEIFDKKNTIPYPYDMPQQFTTDHVEGKEFTIMVNDRVSRLGCAVSLGEGCTVGDNETLQYSYYTTCTYDYGLGGTIYKKGEPTRRCSIWGVGRSEKWCNLCGNNGDICDYNE